MNTYYPQLLSSNSDSIRSFGTSSSAAAGATAEADAVTASQLASLTPVQLEQQTLQNMSRSTGAGPSRFMRPFRTPGGAF